METIEYKDLRIGKTLEKQYTLLPDVSSESIIYSLVNQSRIEQRAAYQRPDVNRHIDGTGLAVGKWLANFCIVGIRLAGRNLQFDAIVNIAQVFDALIVTDRPWINMRGARRISTWQARGGKPTIETLDLSYDVVLFDNFDRRPITPRQILELGRQCHRHETFVIVNIE